MNVFLLYRLVHVLIVLYRFPDGSSSNLMVIAGIGHVFNVLSSVGAKRGQPGPAGDEGHVGGAVGC